MKRKEGMFAKVMKLLPKEKIPAEEITSGSLDNSSSDTVRSLRPERKRDADGRDEEW